MKWKNLIYPLVVLLYCYNEAYAGFSSICEGLDNENILCTQLGLEPQCASKIYCQGELLCTGYTAYILFKKKFKCLT